MSSLPNLREYDDLDLAELLSNSVRLLSSHSLRFGSGNMVVEVENVKELSHTFKYPLTLGSEFLGSGRRVPTPTLGRQGFRPKRGILSRPVIPAFP